MDTSSQPPPTSDHIPTGGEEMSRRKAKKAAKVTRRIKAVPGSVDVRIQRANDDSVVSKRSAVALGYFNDPFLRHFVTKPSRRTLLINRGYYIRMFVMTEGHCQLLHKLLCSRGR